MQKVCMLIGLPGSGKSTWAKDVLEGTNYLYVNLSSGLSSDFKIFSSDEYREKLCGDVNCQDNNQKVFDTLYDDLIEHVKNGGSAIYDATNINRKSRKTLLHRLQDLHIDNLVIQGVVFVTPIEKCIERNNARNRKVPEEVIYSMVCRFELPLTNEGFDNIVYSYDHFSEFYDPIKEFAKMRGFNQDNPNHTETLDIHCFKACTYLLDKTNNKELLTAALFHDLGKYYVAKYNEEKGYTQFIGHENYGAYRCLTTNFPSPIDPVGVALYVNYHMEIFRLKDAKEKSFIKHKNLFKPEFWNNLELLREADLNAH